MLVTGCVQSEGQGENSDTAAGPQRVASGASNEAGVTLRYLGAAGWEISADVPGSTDPVVVLVDPYLTRANYSGAPSPDPDDTRPIYTRSDTLFSDAAVIDAEIASSAGGPRRRPIGRRTRSGDQRRPS